MEPSELLRLQPSEPIASESVVPNLSHMVLGLVSERAYLYMLKGNNYVYMKSNSSVGFLICLAFGPVIIKIIERAYLYAES